MELNKMVYTIITLSVVVISVAAIMMPVLNDATTAYTTFENDHSYYVVKNPETATITYDGTTLQIDSETVDVPDADETPYGVSILSVGNGVIRYNTDGTVFKWGNMGSYTSASITDLDLAIADGALTGTFSTASATDTAISMTLDSDYYVLSTSTESEDVLTISDGNLYINGDTTVQSNGVSRTDANVVNGVVVFNITGSIDDGFTVTGYNRNGGAELTNITFSDVTVNYTEVDGYIDLYKLTNVTFTTTVTDSDDNEITVDHSYDYFAAPLEVTAELSTHLNSGAIALINAIPALVLVCLVMVAVGLSVNKRDD